MLRRLLPVSMAGMLACGGVSAATLDETLYVDSRTFSEEEFLRGEANAGTPVRLTGNLAFPDGEGRFPVVILLHGSDGAGSGAVWAWSRFLDSKRIANLRLDSYTGRGFDQISTDQSRFGQFAQIYDTYRAVEALAAHPKIDGARVAVMGFSRGGNAALYSAMGRFQKSFGPTQGRLVAHLPFYPACNFELVGELELSGAPLREFHGADDDWTPAAPCQAYIDRLATAGNDARMTVYPGALHAFDSPRAPARVSDSDWQTSRNCLRREENGRLVNAATGQPFTYQDACIEYGPSARYNDAAATAAQAAVDAFLKELFAGN